MIIKSILPTIAVAVQIVSAYSSIEYLPSLKYLEPFSSEDAIEQPFELVDNHEDLFVDHKGQIGSLHKRDDCQKYHKVAKGDTCYSIGLKYNVEISDVLNWNDQINTKCTNLYPGKAYCVQKNGETIINEKTCTDTYYVQDGDNCISVAKQHNITLDEFYEMNPSVDTATCSNLLTGGLYCVQQKPKAEVAQKLVASIDAKTTHRTHAAKKVVAHKKHTTKKHTTKKHTTKKHTTKKHTTKKAIVQKVKAVHKKKEQRKLIQKEAEFTYYWIANPDDYDQGGAKVSIKTCDGSKIAKVSQDYADALVMEGTGVVGNNVVNLDDCSCSDYECFMKVDRHDSPFGLTAFGTPLRPFVTIAANDIKRNTKIYVPSIVGWKVPGSSKKHNGCLLVDDQSWSFNGHHIDFYVYREENYKTLNGDHSTTKVDIYEGGDCHLLDYN